MTYIKSILIFLIITSTLALGDVLPNTLYKKDMLLLDVFFITQGVSATVACARIPVHKNNSEKSTVISIASNSYWKGQQSFLGLGFFLGAVGGFTNQTNWHSDYVILSYKNKVLMCTTKAARNFAYNSSKWSAGEILLWIANNLIIEDV